MIFTSKKSISLGITFAIFTYLIAWVVMPPLLASSVALDVSEGVNWGSEWQWGYYKHPPLSSWILYAFYVSFGHTGVYLLSQLCVLMAMGCHYFLAKQLYKDSVGGVTHIGKTDNLENREKVSHSPAMEPLPVTSHRVGLLASVLTLGIYYYTYPTLEFNHNIAQFPIWSGLAWAFYRAVTRQSWQAWLWVGLLGGIGMLIKYSVIFLLLPMALWLIYPRHWYLLKSPKPWLAAVLMLLIFLPHLYWLIDHDWLPLHYAQARGATTSWVKAHLSWVGFLLTQVLAQLPLLLIAWVYRRELSLPSVARQSFVSQDWLSSNFKCLLFYLWLTPVVLLCLISLLFGVGLRDMWGMPMWGLSAVVLAMLVKPKYLTTALPKFSQAVAIWLVIATTLMLVYVYYGHQIRGKPSRMDWSEHLLASNAMQTWQKYSHCPLDSVTGDRWLTALVAMNTGFPSQVFEGGLKKAPWMSMTRLSEHGTLVIWQTDAGQQAVPMAKAIDVPELSTIESLKTAEGTWTIPWQSHPTKPPMLVHWAAYVPSSCRR